MTEEERIAEVTLPPVRVPRDFKQIIDDLMFLEMKGSKIKLYLTADIMREALFKGLRIMLLEREILNKMMEKEAMNGAMRSYTSLVTVDQQGSAQVKSAGKEREAPEPQKTEEKTVGRRKT